MLHELSGLLNRLLTCQATRDAEFEKLRSNNPVAYVAAKFSQQHNLSEVDTAKVVACLMALQSEARHKAVEQLTLKQSILIPIADLELH